MTRLSVADIQQLLSQAVTPSRLRSLISEHAEDPRPGVVSAVERASRRLAADKGERRRLRGLAAQEWALADSGLRIVAGVDEVGRGALAGPVSAGACVFPREVMIPGLDDSKKLTAPVRERLAAQIQHEAVAVCVGHSDPAEIDQLGIVGAVALAMRRALRGLDLDVEHVLVDGRAIDLGCPATPIVRGDSSVRAIAAAAIVAKVTRDALMRDMSPDYPVYNFHENKGYGSPDHLKAIAEYGPCVVHRLSFTPCCQDTLF